jgi:uncharacterized membrane protein
MAWRKGLVFALLLLNVSMWQPLTVLDEGGQGNNSPSNPTGVDVTVTGVTVAYTSSADSAKYKMFSSNYPIIGFNRPAELFVIDGMLNVSSTLTVTVENIGVASSGVIDINVLLLHNEYTYFEFANSTVQMSTLGGGDSNTATVAITPTYAGNHTLVVRATSTVSDDVPTNDALSKSFTVGYDYFNCDSSTAWSFGSGWSMSTDTSISQGRSCHVGNGQSSSYTNNMLASLTTPMMDLSDAISNPTRTNGLSFFYTGSTAANDKLTMYGKNTFGAWIEIGSISGTVDQVFTDGANWQTFTVNNKGANSPIVPVSADLFHRTSQFKYEFTSDASGTDIGFYIDDIVMVYDQKVRPSEYNVSAQGISTNGAIPGEWGSISLRIINTGNISETFIPQLVGLPAGWNAYYTRPSGTSFDPLQGLMVSPGAPQEFNIMIQPDPNASIGFKQMSVQISSNAYTSVSTTLPVQFLVKADRIPVIQPPSIRPSCPPSYTCTFEIDLTNVGGATDVFDISVDTSEIPLDWTVGLAWTQSSSVLIRPDETVKALFTMSVPSNVAPDTIVKFEMSLQSQNDTTRIDVKDIEISASMISIAEVDLVEHQKVPRMLVNAGDQITLEYRIWNNATRQDIFSMRVGVENEGNWVVHQPTRPNAVLNAGASTTFEVMIDVPLNAQADDRGPTITPIIESERSRMVIEGEAYDGLRVSTTHDVRLEILSAPTKLTPGLPNEIALNVINNGNGATTVQLEPSNLPATWNWWLSLDGNNHTGTIPLSVSYDLQHEQEVSLWLLLPMTEAAGELHTISIAATHEGEGEDANPIDNVVEFVAATGTVRLPTISLLNHSTSTMAGEIMFAETVVNNAGNALENRLSVTASVSSVPPITGLVVFFSIDGGDKPAATPVSLAIPGGGEQRLRLEVMVPETAPLNTRFVLRFDIDGAVDENDLPITMNKEVMVLLDQRRSMELVVAKTSNLTVAYGTSAMVMVNHSSTSTITESYLLTVQGEENWQTTCDKRLVNESGTAYDLAPGHLAPQRKQHVCEVLRLGGPLSGKVTFTVATEDNRLVQSHEVMFTFQAPPEDESLSMTILVGSGMGGIAFVVLLLTLLRKRNSDEIFEEVEEALASTQGPPISSHQEQHALEPHPEPMATTPSLGGPPLPASGLPPGWTEEQWAYYGQQYLDGTL